MPLLIPIHEEAFGGKPNDWNDKSKLTVCFFKKLKNLTFLHRGNNIFEKKKFQRF
jgi:hypothetical protein